MLNNFGKKIKIGILMSFVTISKPSEPFILPTQEDTLFTPITTSDTNPPQEVLKEPYLLKAAETDPGIACALHELQMSLMKQAAQNVPYAHLLLPFFTPSET